MACTEHLTLLKRGAEKWNKWRRENLSIIPDLLGAELKAEDLNGVDLHRADLRGASLGKANLKGAYLREADFRESDLGEADLRQAVMSKANLSGAILSFARLHGADLRRADLSSADLKGAELWGADVREANLSKAGLRGADLRGAFLGKANLSYASLQETNLSLVELSFANITFANLKGANFREASVAETIFANVDLSETIGLDSIKHLGPSTIGINTIVRSKGNIHEVFLRGAGVPEPFIVQAKALIGAIEPVQLYSCFISYSAEDQEFVERLYADLQNKGIRCWFAPHDMQTGKKIYEQIDEAIRIYDPLLLILSEESMSSKWVKEEIALATRKEVREKRNVLFPIGLVPFEKILPWKLFDAEIVKDSARKIREYFIPDFSNWKDHDSYRNAFERLLKGFKAENRARSGSS